MQKSQTMQIVTSSGASTTAEPEFGQTTTNSTKPGACTTAEPELGETISYAEHLHDLKQIQTIAQQGVATMRREITEDFSTHSMSSTSFPIPTSFPTATPTATSFSTPTATATSFSTTSFSIPSTPKIPTTTASETLLKEQLTAIRQEYKHYKIHHHKKQTALEEQLHASSSKVSHLEESSAIAKLDLKKKANNYKTRLKSMKHKFQTSKKSEQLRIEKALMSATQDKENMRTYFLSKINKVQTAQTNRVNEQTKTHELLEQQLLLETTSHQEAIKRMDTVLSEQQQLEQSHRALEQSHRALEQSQRVLEQSHRVLEQELKTSNVAKDDAMAQCIALTQHIQHLKLDLSQRQRGQPANDLDSFSTTSRPVKQFVVPANCPSNNNANAQLLYNNQVFQSEIRFLKSQKILAEAREKDLKSKMTALQNQHLLAITEITNKTKVSRGEHRTKVKELGQQLNTFIQCTRSSDALLEEVHIENDHKCTKIKEKHAAQIIQLQHELKAVEHSLTLQNIQRANEKKNSQTTLDQQRKINEAQQQEMGKTLIVAEAERNATEKNVEMLQEQYTTQKKATMQAQQKLNNVEELLVQQQNEWNTALQHEKEEQRSLIAALESTQAALEKNTANTNILATENHVLNKTLQTFKLQLKKDTSTIERLKKDHQNQQKETVTAIELRNKEANQCKKHVALLEKENKTLTSNLNKVQAQTAHVEIACNRLISDHERLCKIRIKEETDRTDAVTHQFQKKIANIQAEKRSLEQIYEQLLETSSKDSGGLDTELSEIKTKYQAQFIVVSQMEQDIHALKCKFESKSNAHEELMQHIQTLKEERDEVKQDRDETQHKHLESIKQLQKSRAAQLDSHANQSDKDKITIHLLQSKLTAVEKRLIDVDQTFMQKLHINRVKHDNSFDSLKQGHIVALQNKCNEYSTLKETTKEITSKLTTSTNERNALKVVVAQLKDKILFLTDEQSRKDKLHELECASLQQSLDEMSESLNEANAFKNSKQATAHELKMLTDLHHSLKNTHHSLTKHAADVENRLSREMEAVQELKNNRSTMKDKHIRFTKELKEAHARVIEENTTNYTNALQEKEKNHTNTLQEKEAAHCNDINARLERQWASLSKAKHFHAWHAYHCRLKKEQREEHIKQNRFRHILYRMQHRKYFFFFLERNNK